MIHCPPLDQRLSVGFRERHRHSVAYATFVLEGSYVERGSLGRWTVEPGHVVVHRVFDSHCNHILGQNSRVLNLAIPVDSSLPPVFTVNEPDALIAAIRARAVDAFDLLRPAQHIVPDESDWPDALAAALSSEPQSISSWAEKMDLAPATVSRGFIAAYGISPSRFRLEAQTLRAVQCFMTGASSSAEIAVECGFSDQAHLCRAVKGLTGQTPGHWQRIKSIQDAGGDPQ